MADRSLNLSLKAFMKPAATGLQPPLFEVFIGDCIRSCRWLVLTCAIAVGLIVSDCQLSNKNSLGTWKIYHNQRYAFEFPYPSNWVPSPMPANRDGQAFSDPLQPDVEIRGSAGYSLPEINKMRYKSPHHKHAKVSTKNFTTQQGLSGELQVEVGSDFSSMTLTLTQAKVLYIWQGQAPSQQFADYYRFFYYIASQFRVSPALN